MGCSASAGNVRESKCPPCRRSIAPTLGSPLRNSPAVSNKDETVPEAPIKNINVATEEEEQYSNCVISHSATSTTDTEHDTSTTLRRKVRRFARRSCRLSREIDLAIRKDSCSTFTFGDFCVGLPNLPTELLSNCEDAVLRSFSVHNLIGHTTHVRCICALPNSELFASCAAGQSVVTIANAATGDTLRTLAGHGDCVSCVCVSHPDASRMLTSSRDGAMVLWDVVTASQLHVFEHQMHVTCCCFSPDARHAVSGCQDEVCRVWDLQSGLEVTTFAEHGGPVLSACFSVDGASILSSDHHQIKHWDAFSALCLYEPPPPPRPQYRDSLCLGKCDRVRSGCRGTRHPRSRNRGQGYEA
eukprot:RCo022448